MDTWNIRNIMRIIGNDRDNKVSLLMDYTDTPRSVADPWYSGDFESTYADVTKGCRALLEHILSTENGID
jgi:protein-tyrosine phosphatase